MFGLNKKSPFLRDYDSMLDYFKINSPLPYFSSYTSSTSTSLSEDVTKTENGWIFGVDVPGFDKSNIEVTITNGVVNIKGTRKDVYTLKNIDITKSIGIDESSIDFVEAKVENGVLYLFYKNKQVLTSKELTRKIEIT